MSKVEIKVSLRDKRPECDRDIHTITTDIDISDLHRVINNLWAELSIKEHRHPYKSGQFEFATVVQGVFRSVAQSLNLDSIIEIKRKC